MASFGGMFSGYASASQKFEQEAYERKKEEERAARERENHAYLLEQRDRERRNQQSMDEGYTSIQKRLQEDTGEQQYENLGLTPRRAQQGYAPAADGYGPTQPQIEAGPSSFNRGQQYNDRKAGLSDELRMARNSPQLMADIQRRHQQGKIDSDAMKIGEYVRSADDATIGELAQKVTLDKQNTYSLKPSKTPGLYTVETKLGNAELNRNQLADYIEGMHRLKMGDPAGKAMINAISPALLAAAEAKRDNLREDSKEARENFGAEGTRQYQNRMAANSGARADRPQYLQLVDDKGEAVVVDQGKLQTGPDGRLLLPAGLKFPRSRPEIDYRAVEARAAALEGKPMAGLDTSGKKQVYTGDTAYTAAMEQLYPSRGGVSGTGIPIGAAPPRNPERTAAPPPPPQTFNPAGYSSVDSAIAGAKRGDRAALEWLKTKAIPQGTTTPAQRALIERM